MAGKYRKAINAAEDGGVIVFSDADSILDEIERHAIEIKDLIDSGASKKQIREAVVELVTDLY
jgi:hypothetical protein